MPSITSLIVKIGAKDEEITSALAKLGSNIKRTEADLKKVGNTPVGQQAQQSLATLNETITRIQTSQQRLADRAKLAAAGITAMGGPARVTRGELEQINRTIQSGLDAYRALGQQAPAELQKVADAVTKQRKQLAEGAKDSGGALGQAKDVLGTLGIGVGALSAAGIVGTLGAGAKAALDYADSLTKLADRTGITATGLQRLDAVASASGNNVEQVASAVNQFQKRLAEGADGTVEAITEIGLSVDQLLNLSPDEQFFAIARGVQSIKDPAEQTRVAMELFGKSGAELLPTLKADIDALADSTFNMSDESVQALDDFGDALGRLKSSAVSALGEVAGSTLRVIAALDRLPTVKTVTVSIVTNVGKGLLQAIPGVTAYQNARRAADLAQQQAAEFDTTPPDLPARPGAFESQTKDGLLAQRRGLSLLAGDIRDQVQAAKDAAAAASKAATAAKAADEAYRKWADGFREVLEGAKGFAAVVDTVDGTVVEGVRYYVERGQSLAKVGDIYGLTAVQVDALGQKFSFEAKLAEAAAYAHGKLATEVYNVATAADKLQARPLTPRAAIPTLQSGANPQLTAASQTFASNLTGVLQKQLPQSILAAIQGGGSIIQAAGSTLGSFLTSKGGLGSQIQKGLTSLLGEGLGAAANALVPGLGALLGPLLNKLGGLLKDAFGGPSQQELDARDSNRSFEESIIGSLTATQRAEAGTERWRQIVVGVRDGYIAAGKSAAEAEAIVRRLWEAERQGPEAVAAIQREIEDTIGAGARARQGAAQFGPSRDELQQMAVDAKATYDYMLQSGQYTAEQLEAAFKASQEAQARAAGINVEAQNKTFGALEANIADLTGQRDALLRGVEAEAPEAIAGVIETQARGQIEALNSQIDAQQADLDRQRDQYAKDLEDALGDIRPNVVRVPVEWDAAPFPYPTGSSGTGGEGAATGGLVTARGIQHFAQGGVVLPFRRRGTDTVPAMLTPGEIVINAAQQGRLASALMAAGGASVSGDVILQVDGREIGRISRRTVLQGGTAIKEFKALLRASGVKVA